MTGKKFTIPLLMFITCLLIGAGTASAETKTGNISLGDEQQISINNTTEYELEVKGITTDTPTVLYAQKKGMNGNPYIILRVEGKDMWYSEDKEKRTTAIMALNLKKGRKYSLVISSKVAYSTASTFIVGVRKAQDDELAYVQDLPGETSAITASDAREEDEEFDAEDSGNKGTTNDLLQIGKDYTLEILSPRSAKAAKQSKDREKDYLLAPTATDAEVAFGFKVNDWNSAFISLISLSSGEVLFKTTNEKDKLFTAKLQKGKRYALKCEYYGGYSGEDVTVALSINEATAEYLNANIQYKYEEVTLQGIQEIADDCKKRAKDDPSSPDGFFYNANRLLEVYMFEWIGKNVGIVDGDVDSPNEYHQYLWDRPLIGPAKKDMRIREEAGKTYYNLVKEYLPGFISRVKPSDVFDIFQRRLQYKFSFLRQSGKEKSLYDYYPTAQQGDFFKKVIDEFGFNSKNDFVKVNVSKNIEADLSDFRKTISGGNLSKIHTNGYDLLNKYFSVDDKGKMAVFTEMAKAAYDGKQLGLLFDIIQYGSGENIPYIASIAGGNSAFIHSMIDFALKNWKTYKSNLHNDYYSFVNINLFLNYKLPDDTVYIEKLMKFYQANALGEYAINLIGLKKLKGYNDLVVQTLKSTSPAMRQYAIDVAVALKVKEAVPVLKLIADRDSAFKEDESTQWEKVYYVRDAASQALISLSE